MTVSFTPVKADGQLFAHLPELDDLEFSLSNANAATSWTPSGSKTPSPQARGRFPLQSPPCRRPAQAHSATPRPPSP